MDKRTLFINTNNHQNNNQSFNGILHNPQNLIPSLHCIWKNEKFAKELLQYEESFFSHLFTTIETREADINKKPFTKEDSDLMELDLQRVKFIVKEYHRIRLCKIEKYLFYILKNDLSTLLSQNEIKFVVELINMKAVYFNDGLKKVSPLVNNFRPFLDKYKNMTDKISAISDEMIVTPDKKSYVIVQINQAENVILNMKDAYEEAEIDLKVLKEGDIEAVPFTLIKESLKDNKMKLI